METPQHSMNVWATLASGETILAYWLDGTWWTGVVDNPIDIVVNDEVISWNEVE
jgi:hypothetical protein